MAKQGEMKKEGEREKGGGVEEMQEGRRIMHEG